MLYILTCICISLDLSAGFPGSSAGKESTCNAGDPSMIPGLGRSTGEGKGHPLQYSCLEKPMVREAWQATVHGVGRVQRNLVTSPPAFFMDQLSLSLS